MKLFFSILKNSRSMVRLLKDELLTSESKPRATTLAAIESLAIPLVQEVVFVADFRCSKCQQRVAQIMSKMNGETQSVVISVLEKKVSLTYSYSNPNKRPVNRSLWSKNSLIVRLFRAS